MKSDNKIKGIQELTAAADNHLLQSLSLIAPLWLDNQLSGDQRITLSHLSGAALRVSGSAMLLVELDRPWDAEILVRTITESTLVFCHLLGDKDQLSERFKQYTEVLPDINALADHAKAKQLLDLPDTLGIARPKAIEDLLLSSSEYERMSALYPRKERSRIKRQWGFTAIIESMIRSGENLGENAAALLHGYSVSSHVSHSDYLGISIVAERESRPEIRRIAMHEAHSARILSDILMSQYFRLHTAYKFLEKNTDDLRSFVAPEQPVWRRLQELQTKWTQIEYG